MYYHIAENYGLAGRGFLSDSVEKCYHREKCHRC